MRTIGMLALWASLGLIFNSVAAVTPVSAADGAEKDASAPVTIESCRSFVVNAGKARPVTGLDVRFVVRGEKEASVVRFAVSAPSRGTEALEDVGRFSPGVTIRHTFAVPSDGTARMSYRDPDLHCEVEQVRFTDGTRWVEGSM